MILRNLIVVITLAVSILLPTGGRAAELVLAPGVTSQGGATANIGLSFDWDRRWFESETGHLSGYWNVGYTWWEGGSAGGAAHSVSFAPVFVYHFPAEQWRPFIEIGVGAALFSRSRVGDKMLGSTAHFEDRLGIGMQLSDADTLTLRAIHYSNAGFKSPNQGIESWSLVYNRRF